MNHNVSFLLTTVFVFVVSGICVGCYESNNVAKVEEQKKVVGNEINSIGEQDSKLKQEDGKKKPTDSKESNKVQAYSLLGHSLESKQPSEKLEARYQKALGEFKSNPRDRMNLIWVGRFEAYCGRYDQAIERFTQGTKLYPDDPRFLRHRGHRYITIRKLDLAIADLEKAAKLIEGTADKTEPDGMPNAKNIPVSSLHTNIWYHLGLAYFCKNEFKKAAEVYEKGLKACQNDDMRVAFTHWAYMAYRQLGDKESAAKVLEPIKIEMKVIESFDYHKLCLLYKKLKTVDEIQAKKTPESNGSSEALQLGIANWYLNETDDGEIKASKMLESLCRSKNWPAFGCIAAESTYKRVFGVLGK